MTVPWIWRIHLPCNSSIYQKGRNSNARKRDWNTKRRKQQTKAWYEWNRNINEKSKLNKESAKQMWQKETWQTQKHHSRQNASLETRNRFAQDEVLDIETKT